MPWWGWVVLGLFLLGSELLGVEAAFFLVFIGISALMTGLAVLSGVPMEPWVQWVLFSTLAVISMVLFRKKLYDRLRGQTPDYQVGPSGETVQLQQALAPGERCRLTYRGSDWTLINQSEAALEAGSQVTISRVDGLNLIVE